MTFDGVNSSKVVTFATTGIEDRLTVNEFENRVIDRLRDAAIEEPAPRGNHFGRIAWLACTRGIRVAVWRRDAAA